MRPALRNSLTISTLLVSLSLLAVPVGCKKNKGGPVVELPKEKPAKFPYEIFDEVVKTYVNDKGRVDYKGLSGNRKNLDLFVAYVGKYGPETAPDLFPTKQDKMAYYINGYNALVLTNIINRYPPAPKNDGKVAQTNFFVTTKFIVDGKEISLYALENDIVRPVFKDPRVHFALNCAARGCPQLPQEAFVPERLDEQLDRETKKFVMEDRNVYVDAEGILRLSDIPCNFYPKDFVEYEQANGGPTGDAGNKDVQRAAVVSYYNRYRPEDKKLNAPSSYKGIKCIPYDWTPNDQAIAE